MTPLLALFSCLLIAALLAAPGVKSAISGVSGGGPVAVPDTFSSTPSSNSWFTDGVVRAIDSADDGTTYIGGDFTHVWPRTGPGVPVDSTSAQAVAAFPIVSAAGAVNAVVTDGSGGWYVGGSFASIGGLAYANLAHISADGSVDTAWAPQPNSRVNELLRDGNRIFAAGEFTSIGGKSRAYLAELDISGATTGEATAWNPSPSDYVHALEASGDSLYVGGDFESISGAARSRVARVDISGATTGDVSAWDPSPDSTVHAIAVTGSTVYLGGTFTQMSSDVRNSVAAVTAGGTGDVLSWDPDANAGVSDIEVDGETVYLAGSFTAIGVTTRSRLAALNLATAGPAALTSWDPVADNSVLDIEINGGTLFAGGAFSTIGGEPRNHAAAITATVGSPGPVTAWDPNASGPVNAIAVSGSTVYLGGSFPGIGGYDRQNLASFNATGDATTWNPGADSSVRALLTNGGTVYAGGDFVTVDGQARNRIAAIDSTGSALSWNPGADGTVRALEISEDVVYAGGDFTEIAGQPRNRLAAVDASGAATDWSPEPNGTVRTMDLDGSLFVGGDFSEVGGAARSHLAALDVTGATTGEAALFDVPVNQPVHAIDIDDGIVYLAGEFTQVDGISRVRAAAIDPGDFPYGTYGPGELATWNPSINGNVYALDVQGSKVYIGGDFTMVYASLFTRSRLAAIDKATSKPTVWAPDPDGSVYAISAGQTVVQAGGSFVYGAGGEPIQGFARYEGADTVPPATEFATDPSVPDGDSGWFITTPDVMLTSDEAGISQYQWNGTSADSWSYGDNFPAISGANSLYFRSIDTAGNTGDTSSQLISVDTELPQDPAPSSTSHTISDPSSNGTIVMEWPSIGEGSAADNISGVDGYSFEWSSEPGTVPDSNVDIDESITGVTSDALTTGSWYFHLRTKDLAGNWSSAVHIGPFVVDGAAPVTTIGLDPVTPDGTSTWYKTVPQVTLTRSESGTTEYNWDTSADVTTDSSATVTFDALAGKHTLYYRSIDSGTNAESWKTRTIWVDASKPSVAGPYNADHSVKVAKRTSFYVTWGASDAAGGSGLLNYDLLYKKGVGGTWKSYKSAVTSRSVYFTGSQASTYYFKVRARDKAGNIGYSAVKYTIIPADERAATFSANWTSVSSSTSGRFMGTTRYNKKKFASMSYKFTGSNVSVIATRGPGRGKAWVYIDGYFIKTIDTGRSSVKHREVFVVGSTSTNKTHTLKVVNQATSGRPMLELDGIAVKK